MATLPQYDRAGQIDRGNLWFSCLSSKSEIATFALSSLNKRNYSGKKDDKGKVVVADHHAEGLALFTKFKASVQDRSAARPIRIKHVDASEAEAGALRRWVRDHHAELVGIRRGSTGSELAALPSAQDLDTLSGLRRSATDLISFFSSPAVQPALATYGLSADDGKVGEALLNAWDTARGSANNERGGETGKTKTNMTDREAFVAWLGTWWSIAKVRFRDRPDVLAALGVETGIRRGASGNSAPSNADAEASVTA